MAIRIVPELDKKKFEGDLAGLRSKVGEELRKGGDEGGKALSSQLSTHLKKVSFGNAVGAIKEVTGAFKEMGPTLTGLDKKMVDAGANVVDTTASFAQMGFELGGPWGAAIGGGIGLVSSLTTEIIKAKEEAENMTSVLQTQAKIFGALVKAHIAFSTAQTEGARAQRDALEAIDKHLANPTGKKGLAELKKEADAAHVAFLGLKGAVDLDPSGQYAKKHAEELAAAIKKDEAAAAAYAAALKGDEGATSATKKLGKAAKEAAVDFEALNRARLAPAQANKTTAAGLAGAMNEAMGANIVALEKYRTEWEKTNAAILEAQFTAIDFGDEASAAIAASQKEMEAFKESIKVALLDVGRSSVLAFFDAIQDGQPILQSVGKSFALELAQVGKTKGAELFMMGVVDAAHGTSMLIKSAGLDPRGVPMVGHGLKEMATGLTMGAAGAGIGRLGGMIGGGGGRGGRDRDEAGSGSGTLFGGAFTPGFNGPRDPGPSTTNNATTINVQVGFLAPGDRDESARAGRRVGRAIADFLDAGGRLPRRLSGEIIDLSKRR